MLSDDSDGEEIHQFTINEHYAKAFEYRKEREELAKLKEKYGSDIEEAEGDEDEDSEDAESEDEDGDELTPAMDAAILRTLARIRRKDPAIYEASKDVFEEERQKLDDAKAPIRVKDSDKSKPLTIRQHALASVLEDVTGSRSPSPAPLTHVQEQKKLRAETVAAFHTAVKSEDEEEEDLLIPRSKTKDEIEREEEEYRAFLEREVGEDLSGLITVEDTDGAGASGSGAVDVKEERTKKKSKKSKNKNAKSKHEDDQEFLMNYILNRGWIDKTARRLPTYNEITDTTSQSKKGKGKAPASDSDDSDDHKDKQEEGDADEEEDLDEDDFDEVADRFESSYNFRFEEPGATEIARHPRNLSSLVRREDTTRKEAREKRKARKEEELIKKREEVKRLKALKIKELRAKLERIGHEGGKRLDDTEALQTLDLDGDWDPEAHDRKMAELYAAGGMEDEGEDGFVDEEKPTWDDDIDITDIVPSEANADTKKKKKKKKKKSDDDDMDDGAVNIDEMDADVEMPAMSAGDEDWDGTEEMRKRVLEKYMDEVYGLDFNDMTAGMPTRFKYTPVDSQTFGLSPAEILLASDAELNTYMGLRKYAPYRKEGKGRNWDAQRTMRLTELKQALRERSAYSGAMGVVEDGGRGEKGKKRKGKKERMREKAAAATTMGEGDAEDGEGNDEDAPVDLKEAPRKKEKKEKKRKREADGETDGEVDGEEGDMEEGAAKKRRRRHRKHAAAAT